jgi:hypothetical protein
MGTAQEHSPVLLILAAFSRHDQALDWARKRSETEWGQIVLSSDIVPFDYTTYYEATMGGGLKKVLWAYEALIDPTQLVGIKHRTNEWEDAYRQLANCPEPRPLNLDPGYVTEAKLILATTKDRNHRIYLGRGIFAEVTLHYRRGGVWSGHPWTYADYRSEVYHDFLTQCRGYLRRRNRAL